MIVGSMLSSSTIVGSSGTTCISEKFQYIIYEGPQLIQLSFQTKKLGIANPNSPIFQTICHASIYKMLPQVEEQVLVGKTMEWVGDGIPIVIFHPHSRPNLQ